MKKKAVWFFGGIVLIVVAFALYAAFAGNKTEKQSFKTAKVTKGNIQATVSSTGTVNPLNTINVGSQVSGTIKETLVDFNSEVKKDQIIAQIEPDMYLAKLEQARAGLLGAETQLKQSQKDTLVAKAGVVSAEAGLGSAAAVYRNAETHYNRSATLASNKIVSLSELDAALAARDNAKGALDIAQAKVQIAEAQLQRALAQEKGAEALIIERKAAYNLAKINLNYCTIKSPIDGIIISRAVDVGQTVAATLQSPTLFIIAEDLTRMQVEVDVSEADVGQIKAGQTVEFTVDAFPDKKFTASVRQVRNAPTNIQNVVSYKMVADVDNNGLLLKPGMTANATIIVANEEDILKVPNGALRFKPIGEIKEAKPKQPSVKDSELYKRTVEGLKLDADQAKKLEEIISQAWAKKTAADQTAQTDEDRQGAWRTFFTQVSTQLRTILNEEQLRQYDAYLKYRASSAAKRAEPDRGKPGKVYILDESKAPVALDITIGISNESETKVIQGELKEGDEVIVGLAFPTGEKKQNGNPLVRMFTGRGR